MLLLFAMQGVAFAQNPLIDNQGYWQEMADQGLAIPNPTVTVPAPTYKGGSLPVPLALYYNSPDIFIKDKDPGDAPPANNVQTENSIFINPLDPTIGLNSNNSANIDFVNAIQTFLGTSGFAFENPSDDDIEFDGQVTGTGGANQGDPAAVINTSGRFFIGHIQFGQGQGVAFSDDNGVTWTERIIAPDPNPLSASDLLDKNHFMVDNYSSSTHHGNLYSAWTHFQANDNVLNQHIEISRSTDDGLNWSTPIKISGGINGELHQGVNIQTGPNGDVYTTWAVYDNIGSNPQNVTEDAIGFAKSTDGGATFSAASRVIDNISGIRQTGVGKNMRVNSFPSMAVDVSGGLNNGDIYIVFPNNGVPGVNGGTDSDVYIIKSTDGGTNWSAPVRVNQDPVGNGKQQYHSWVACDPETGVLAVIFYDDRDAAANQVEAWVAISGDGGATWTDFRVSDVAFTPSPIPGASAQYFGDYLGIDIQDNVVYPVWTDNRPPQAASYTSPFVLGCLDDVVLLNGFITSNDQEEYYASNSISVAGGGTQFFIDGTPTGADVLMQAENYIHIKEGFEAEEGAVFHAKLGVCPYDLFKKGRADSDDEGDIINGASDLSMVKNYKIVPNPNKGHFQVIFDNDKLINPALTVHSLMGEMVFAKRKVGGANEVAVDLSHAASGVYLVRILDGNTVQEVLKVVVTQ